GHGARPDPAPERDQAPPQPTAGARRDVAVRRARLALTVLAAIVVVALVVGAGKVAWPRWEIARLVARAEGPALGARIPALVELAAVDDPEATVALVQIYARGIIDDQDSLQESVEIHAALAPPGDPRVRAALSELARDPMAPDGRRLMACYLIEEL